DPLGYVDGINLYQYARLLPLVYADPYGLACEGSGVSFELIGDRLYQHTERKIRWGAIGHIQGTASISSSHTASVEAGVTLTGGTPGGSLLGTTVEAYAEAKIGAAVQGNVTYSMTWGPISLERAYRRVWDIREAKYRGSVTVCCDSLEELSDMVGRVAAGCTTEELVIDPISGVPTIESRPCSNVTRRDFQRQS